MTDLVQDAGPRVPGGEPGEAAAGWLSRCVGDAEGFLASFGGAPYLSRGDSGRFGHLLSLAELGQLIAMGAIPAMKVKLVKHDQPVPARAWAKEKDNILVPDGDRVDRLIGDGCTMVITGVDRYAPGLFELCGGLQGELSYRLGANIYLTPPFAQGFSTHFDEHDVLVLQLDGEKEWQVFDRVTDRPGQAATVTPAQPPLIDTTLRKGDSLYIPRGFAHCAKSAGHSSLHASIGIYPSTVGELLGYAAGLLAESPALARPLPPGFAHSLDDIDELLTRTMRALSTHLNNADASDAIAHAFCRSWIEAPPRGLPRRPVSG
jgi:hypothetical protein